jgi:hypothetical protein
MITVSSALNLRGPSVLLKGQAFRRGLLAAKGPCWPCGWATSTRRVRVVADSGEDAPEPGPPPGPRAPTSGAGRPPAAGPTLGPRQGKWPPVNASANGRDSGPVCAPAAPGTSVNLRAALSWASPSRPRERKLALPVAALCDGGAQPGLASGGQAAGGPAFNSDSPH